MTTPTSQKTGLSGTPVENAGSLYGLRDDECLGVVDLSKVFRKFRSRDHLISR